MSKHRSEHWVVLSGMPKVTDGEERLCVNANWSTYIPPAISIAPKTLGLWGWS